MDENSCCCTESNCCGTSTVKSIIPNVTTALNMKDILGAWKVRWGIGRDNYTVEPGLYSVGKPNSNSPVLVTANYKLTFDILRKNLSNLDCWLLILDTKGINVWCAAGKGTFGTCELISRIDEVGLNKIVEHRKLIVPQLGATGISAHEVSKHTGFSVIYGPVRANDIKEFISNDYVATKEMRTVKFTLWDRIVLIPIELVSALKNAMIVFGVLFLINLVANRQFGIQDFIIYFASIISGTMLIPIFLPVVPGRAFAFKGWFMGLITTACIAYFFGWFNLPNLLLGIAYMLLLPAHSAFLAMNFTGSSTYTSFSGVLKEMKIAVPAIIISSVVGAILLLIKTFIR
jgi:hypothetical protein